MQTTGFLAIAYLAASGLWTANDPFVGKWRLDVARSTIVDRMVVEAAGPNRYTFRFEGSPAETVVADGTDQPGLPGTTLAVKSEDPRRLKVVRKQGGRVIVSAAWKLSPDGRTLHDTFTGQQPDGSTPTTEYVYRRVSGRSGFIGAWESTTSPVGLKYEIEIRPHGPDGLAFVAQGAAKTITFDGREHRLPGGMEGLTVSGRRGGAHALQYAESNGGKLQRTRAFQLSRDGRTMTMTLRTPGETSPAVFVFERE